MACTSSSFTPFLVTHNSSKPISRVLCHLPNANPKEEEEEEDNAKLDVLKLSVTLAVVSASLPQPAIAAKASRSAKKPEAITPQQLKAFSQGLPLVSNRLPYTDVLDFKRNEKLKHVIKPPNASLRQRSEVVLAVLEDSRVVRIVLPSLQSDPNFWDEWSRLGIDGVCINAYTPPLKTPEVPSPYLGVLAKIPLWMFSLAKAKPQSKKALEFKRAREELKRGKNEEMRKMREERERMEKAMKSQRKMEERKKKLELQKLRSEQSQLEARRSSQNMAIMWENLASDSNVTTALGLVFFYIFYRTVVLNYRKQKKDYDDRLKIEKAEAEEKKKIRELENKMAGLEDEADELQSGEGGEGEQNPYMQMAKEFMKSGARVRRAGGKRLPQYLERDVDVKFEDVAGLGKIREELEEIVKFFTYGDMYRRRGVKIPGHTLVFYLISIIC